MTSSAKPVRIPEILWSGGNEAALRDMLIAGALFWCLCCAAYLLAKGVVLDQAVTRAMVIANAVSYPAGHPDATFYRRAFNIDSYILAGLWRIKPDPVFLSSLRNFEQLWLAAFAAFGFVVLFTGKPFGGHLAAAVILYGHVPMFGATYPIDIQPNLFSDGQIGLQFSLVAVLLLLAGFPRLGGFLLGVVPVVHLAMAVIVWPWSILFRRSRTFLIWAAAGAAISAMLAAYVLWGTPLPPAPPYDQPLNSQTVYENFTRWTDVHRPPVTGSLVFHYLLNCACFFTVGFCLRRCLLDRGRDVGALHGILMFGGTAWSYIFLVWLISLAHLPIPKLVQISMPYRFSNFSAVLLIPLSIAIVPLLAPEKLLPALRGAALAAAVFIAFMIAGPDPRNAGLRNWLDRETRRDEMILPHLDLDADVQVETGHPVLMDEDTLWKIPYMPELAGVIGAMTKDIYGVDYTTLDAPLSERAPNWTTSWTSRSTATWQQLGRKYNFRLVLCPKQMRLDLPVCFRDAARTLYRIP